MGEGWKRFYEQGQYHYVRFGTSLCYVAERGDLPFLERGAKEKLKELAACPKCLRLFNKEQANAR